MDFTFEQASEIINNSYDFPLDGRDSLYDALVSLICGDYEEFISLARYSVETHLAYIFNTVDTFHPEYSNLVRQDLTRELVFSTFDASFYF